MTDTPAEGGGGFNRGYFNGSAAFIGGVDNLMVAQLVPEPGSLGLLALTGGLLARRRRPAAR